MCLWTAFLGEVAKLFGCSVGLSDAQTALAFVAGGTSLPGLFVSRLAMMHDSNCQAALENMTGSNSVNVFVGLGVPWLIASVYHAVAPSGKGVYSVPAGSLSFSVALYCGVAGLCTIFQLYRRVFIGADFGGSSKAQSLISAVLLTVVWIVYVIVCCQQAEA